MAHRRHAIEQFHEEAKGELGWDQYQGRLWPGFHRHAVTVMLAYSFLGLAGAAATAQRQGGRVAEATLFPLGRSPGAQTLPAVHREVALMAAAPGRTVVGDDGSVHRTLLI